MSGCSLPGDAADGLGALAAFADALGLEVTQRLERGWPGGAGERGTE